MCCSRWFGCDVMRYHVEIVVDADTIGIDGLPLIASMMDWCWRRIGTTSWALSNGRRRVGTLRHQGGGGLHPWRCKSINNVRGHGMRRGRGTIRYRFSFRREEDRVRFNMVWG